jgi:hypothetical protein
MFLVQGGWRRAVLYGAISLLLLCIFQFGWFGIVTSGDSPSAQAARERAFEKERVIDRFNSCLATAGESAGKVHACQRQRYGYVPKP